MLNRVNGIVVPHAVNGMRSVRHLLNSYRTVYESSANPKPKNSHLAQNIHIGNTHRHRDTHKAYQDEKEKKMEKKKREK